ncbi:hypothetical protein [Burkholderia gladioli]|uniref:hypothetical protein n=1 Tax=Burkholderia gladioli TaxID=28095 RepID=UPI0016415AB6|nr:hypothetical protein [Burkholderia gladioli]MBU9174013.1 hypothetical protein [Burkholderia gladioli]
MEPNKDPEVPEDTPEAQIEFWDRAFLASLPVAMQVSGWKFDGVTISSTAQRAFLAGVWADFATKERYKRVDLVRKINLTTPEGDLSDGGNAD